MSKVRHDLFAPANFEALRRPTLEASVLPPYCYTSPQWYEREVEHIFLKDWLMVDRADRIPNVGDYFVVEIVGESVIVARGHDGQVRAFANTCRHRGTPIAAGQGNCKAFRCPYHRWTYSLEGALLGAPEMQQTKGFDRSDFSLTPVRLDRWDGFLFITFDPDAPTLREFLGDFPAKMAKYRPAELQFTRKKVYDLACNWKVYVDNSIECYHLPSVHGGTIEEYAPMDAWWPEPVQGAYLMLYGMFPDTLALLKGTSGFPAIEGLGGEGMKRHDIPWILPNTHILATTDVVWWLTMYPMGPERTRVEVNTSFPRTTVARPDFPEVVQRYYGRVDTTNPEDNRMAELQQQGLRQRLCRPGRFSFHEQLVHEFANYIVDRVVGPA
jgi:choline monooxygenase